MRVIFKKAGHAMGMTELHTTLPPILRTLFENWPSDELIVTSLNRTAKEDAKLGASGIHSAGPPWRAIDIGIQALDAEGDVAQKKADAIAETINAIWLYDAGRPHLRVAVSAKHGTGPHLHIQVHNATKRRPPQG